MELIAIERKLTGLQELLAHSPIDIVTTASIAERVVDIGGFQIGASFLRPMFLQLISLELISCVEAFISREILEHLGSCVRRVACFMIAIFAHCLLTQGAQPVSCAVALAVLIASTARQIFSSFSIALHRN